MSENKLTSHTFECSDNGCQLQRLAGCVVAVGFAVPCCRGLEGQRYCCEFYLFISTTASVIVDLVVINLLSVAKVESVAAAYGLTIVVQKYFIVPIVVIELYIVVPHCDCYCVGQPTVLLRCGLL